MISFVVIAYNEERSIAGCLEAIVAQRPAEDFEIVVVDDGSTDHTPDVLDELCARWSFLRVVSQGNLGRGAARAAGVRATRGGLVAMVDADILLPPTWLSTCLTALERYDAVGGTPLPDGDVEYVCRRLHLDPRPTPANTVVTGSNGLYRRAVLEDVGFDSRLREGEDVDANHRWVANGYRLACLPELYVRHCEHKTLPQAICWMYESGRGATRQLLGHRRIRRPDAAFLGALALVAWPRLARRTSSPGTQISLLALYLLLVSERHLRGKVLSPTSYEDRARYAAAVVLNAALIAAYFSGRSSGLCRAAWMLLRSGSAHLSSFRRPRMRQDGRRLRGARFLPSPTAIARSSPSAGATPGRETAGRVEHSGPLGSVGRDADR
jgi:GT2 family glycosyltransferase